WLCFTRTSVVTPKRKKYIFARWIFAKSYTQRRTRTSHNLNATLLSCIIRVAITRRQPSFIEPRSRAGRRPAGNLPKITRLLHRITPISYVLLVRHAKRIKWKFVRARGAWANLIERQSLRPVLRSTLLFRPCSSPVYAHCWLAVFLLAWRNCQTRTAQDRMGQPVEVRVLSRAIVNFCGAGR